MSLLKTRPLPIERIQPLVLLAIILVVGLCTGNEILAQKDREGELLAGDSQWLETNH